MTTHQLADAISSQPLHRPGSQQMLHKYVNGGCPRWYQDFLGFGNIDAQHQEKENGKLRKMILFLNKRIWGDPNLERNCLNLKYSPTGESRIGGSLRLLSIGCTRVEHWLKWLAAAAANNWKLKQITIVDVAKLKRSGPNTCILGSAFLLLQCHSSWLVS